MNDSETKLVPRRHRLHSCQPVAVPALFPVTQGVALISSSEAPESSHSDGTRHTKSDLQLEQEKKKLSPSFTFSLGPLFFMITTFNQVSSPKYTAAVDTTWVYAQCQQQRFSIQRLSVAQLSRNIHTEHTGECVMCSSRAACCCTCSSTPWSS